MKTHLFFSAPLRTHNTFISLVFFLFVACCAENSFSQRCTTLELVNLAAQARLCGGGSSRTAYAYAYAPSVHWRVFTPDAPVMVRGVPVAVPRATALASALAGQDIYALHGGPTSASTADFSLSTGFSSRPHLGLVRRARRCPGGAARIATRASPSPRCGTWSRRSCSATQSPLRTTLTRSPRANASTRSSRHRVGRVGGLVCAVLCCAVLCCVSSLSLANDNTRTFRIHTLTHTSARSSSTSLHVFLPAFALPCFALPCRAPWLPPQRCR